MPFFRVCFRLIFQVLELTVKWLVRSILYISNPEIVRAKRHEPVQHEDQEGKLYIMSPLVRKRTGRPIQQLFCILSYKPGFINLCIFIIISERYPAPCTDLEPNNLVYMHGLLAGECLLILH